MTGSIHCPAIAYLAQPGHSDDGEGASGRLSWVRESGGERAEERTDKRTNDQLATKRSSPALIRRVSRPGSEAEERVERGVGLFGHQRVSGF